MASKYFKIYYLILPKCKQFALKAVGRVTVTVAPSTSLFVFQRRNQPPPPWLVEGFVPTGERIGKVSIEPNRENKPVAFDIWRRDMPEGGEVVLGPPARPGSIGASTILYGTAALPVESAPRKNR